MRTEKQELMEQFLKDVDAQIAYEPMHAPINEELRAHIEDKAEMYMEFGVEESVAYEKAVRDMGEPDVLGMQMNETHHLRIAKPLLCLIGILSLIGLAGSVEYTGMLFSGKTLIFFWGFFVLGVVTIYGYPLMLKYAKEMLIVFGACCALLFALKFGQRILDMPVAASSLIFRLFSPSVVFGILQLFIPALTIFLYRKRKKKCGGLVLVFLLEASALLFVRFSWNDSMFIPGIVLIATLFSVMVYLFVCYDSALGKRKGILGAVLGMIVLLILFFAFQWTTVSENIKLFFHPEMKASVCNSWDDSYNNVLIRELLGRAELLGEIPLSEEELIRYGTSQWYYEDGDGKWNHGSYTLEEEINYQMQFLEDPKLEDILPQHYHNNYRIAWWALKYGILPALCILGVIVAAEIAMFWTALRIRNHLGRLVALAGSITLLVQNLFYFAGNLGCQFGAFGNLPFISEGWVSITGTMLLAGLVLSAYRFDTVVKESGD